ncbi:MAG: NAD(P)H-binding protein [Actinomycetaceae bacterium]|nr:NAD(P)H-binding protein [Actinomycetaceae bacterium]
MSKKTHVVLGGNGVVGRETIRALLKRGERVISVGRKPSKLDVESRTADLLESASRAMEGADVAYFVVGIPISTRIMTDQWTRLVHNAIDGAIEHGTHLIYLDNVWAYGPVNGRMTEETAILPTSKKGRIRAQALDLLFDAVDRRGLGLTIARSADFYGPGSTGVFTSFVSDRIAAGKNASWIFDADQPHSLTYTPDIGEALAILGERTPGETWHLPTAPALTGRRYGEIAGSSKVGVLSPMMMRMASPFSRDARETLELSYQYTAPYIFDSGAFEQAFDFKPTPVEEAVAACMAAARKS